MPEDRFVVAHDGIRIAVRDHAGVGPDLVLLHGGGATVAHDGIRIATGVV